MSIPPRFEPRDPLPDDPTIQVASSHQEATAYDLDQPPTDPTGPPRTPLVVAAILIAALVLGGVIWFIASQQNGQSEANATATAVTQATATAQAVAAQQAAANSQAAAAQQAAAAATQQATTALQATTTAQQAAVALSTATAQTAAAAQVGATAQAVSVQATAAADAARAAPTATPVVVVVTAPPQPAPAAPPPAAKPAVPQQPQAAAPAPTPVQPAPTTAAPAPTTGQASAAAPLPPAPLPVRPNASPAASQPQTTVAPVSVTTAPGRPTQLRCLSDRVTFAANADALPPQMQLTCGAADPASVQAPPSPVVAGTLFRLDVSPNDGNALKGSMDVRVTYPADAVSAADRPRVALGYFDGTNWLIVANQTSEPSSTSVSAKLERAGTYALYLKP